MTQKPEEVIFISYNEKFADCWTLVLEYPEHGYEETIATSKSPSHPQGVFSHIADYAIEEVSGEKAEWEDLPEELQKWIAFYISEVKARLY